MEYIHNLGFLKEQYNKASEIKKMVDTLKVEVSEFNETFSDDYNKMSEWGHMYFCDDDGAILKYNRSSPSVHVCSLCGKEYRDEHLDNVWVYFYRGEAILTALKAATAYKISGDKKQLEIVYKILDYYASNYKNFVIHSKDAAIEITTTGQLGYARIMPQELNEAMIMIKICRIVAILEGELSKELTSTIYEMFDECYRLLAPQANKVHNKPCWSICAIGSMGLIKNDQEMIDFAFRSEFNINRQLKEGISSGIWYEGSMYYSFFTLEGISDLLMFAKKKHSSEDLQVIEASVYEMLATAYEYAFDNLIFPNPNDGWPDINLKTFSFLYHMAYNTLGEEKIGRLLRTIEQGPIERRDPQLGKPYYYNNKLSLEELLFNADFDKRGTTLPKSKTQKFASANVAILKNERVNVFIKYGHQARSHAHGDKMNIEFTLDNKLISRDLSNSGYVSRFCNEWHRVSASHNTVVVDGKNHTSVAGGEILNFGEKNIEVESKDIYEGNPQGVNFRRSIYLNEAGFADNFMVETKSAKTLDLFQHLEAGVKLLTELKYQPATLGYSSDGYEHLSNIREVEVKGDELELEFKLEELVFYLKLDLCDKKLFICDSFDNPVDKKRTTLILRSTLSADSYHLMWSIK